MLVHTYTHRGIFNRLVLVTYTHANSQRNIQQTRVSYIHTHRGIFNRLVLVTYTHAHAQRNIQQTRVSYIHTRTHTEEYSTDSC